MKFRAKMTDLRYIRTFSQLLQALSRCSRNFVLRITADKMIFVLNDKEADKAATAIGAWGEVPKDPYTCEYGMEGVSQEDNEILLEISPDKIASCLSSLRSTTDVAALKIKLTKKVVPCLTFEIDLQTIGSAPSCVHDVPVSLVRLRDWDYFKEPNIPAFDISIAVPELKDMRLALERLKNLGSCLHIKVGSDGKLSMCVKTYSVTCTVKFQDLKLFDISSDGVSEPDPVTDPRALREYTVDVDMKTLLNLMSSDFLHQMSKLPSASTSILSISDCRKLHLYYLVQDISLQYCIPSIAGSV